MRVGYQYRVGSVSTLYRCSPVEVYAGVYLPEFLFRLLGYPLFLVVVEYTGLEYVAGKFRVTAGAANRTGFKKKLEEIRKKFLTNG